MDIISTGKPGINDREKSAVIPFITLQVIMPHPHGPGLADECQLFAIQTSKAQFLNRLPALCSTEILKE